MKDVRQWRELSDEDLRLYQAEETLRIASRLQPDRSGLAKAIAALGADQTNEQAAQSSTISHVVNGHQVLPLGGHPLSWLMAIRTSPSAISTAARQRAPAMCAGAGGRARSVVTRGVMG